MMIYKFVLPAVLFLTNAAYAQIDSSRQEAFILKSLLVKNHYQPRLIDDQLSQQLFREVFESLDPNGVYFTQADVEKLSSYRTHIDDELNGKGWEFLPAVTRLYREKLASTEKMIGQVLDKPLTFNAGETISFYSKKDAVSFAADEKALSQRWSRLLKYQVLYQMVHSYEAGQKDKSGNHSSFLSREPELRQKVKTIQLRMIKKISDHPGGLERYVAAAFLNAFASRYDPHTYYLSRTEWENMEGHLSPDGYSFGLDFEETEEGEIKIARLVPGGPAWKSNELHEEDVLVSLRWEGREAMELIGTDVHEVASIMESSNDARLEITIRRTNGQVKTVWLQKEKIREEENVVKSFVLKGERKIGYISLPAFYSDWDQASGKGCANDVAKEILKLQRDGIEGLILDIRNNGGGSMEEGLNLAGIFINEGPLFVVKGKDGKAVAIKDQNRGTIYDGPMVVMVNGLSASASEIVASTLQDYHRAVIIGSQTFGKATTQGIFPLDTNIRSFNDPSALRSAYGTAGITIGKIYRVTGGSAQLNGVRPDVVLPDIYEKLEFGEKSYPLALVNDSIVKKIYYSPLPLLPAKDLSSKSADRIRTNENFKLIRNQADKYASMQEEMQHIPLSYDEFRKNSAEMKQWWEGIEQSEEKDSQVFTAGNTSYEKEVMTMDTYSRETNEVLIKKLQRDIYVEETFLILNDLIYLTKK